MVKHIEKTLFMITEIKVSTIYKCSLERAFKVPMLCDISKIHTGFGMIPKVTHTLADQNWGKSGSSKKVYMAKSLFQKAGFSSVDHVIERIENHYWMIQVDDFQSWTLGFYKFVGTWKTIPIEENKIQVEYTYFLHSKNMILYPLQWIFGKTLWKVYMKRVLENIRILIHCAEPYLFK